MAVETRNAPVYQRSAGEFPYDKYMEDEGLPVHRALIGIDDVTKLPRKPWARMGGNGAFIQLEGTFQSERGIYVADIPGGGAQEPEKHLYEEEIFILQGRGTGQVWQGNGEKLTFEWGPGSIFAFPRNTSHRLLNGSREEVIYMGVTSAPRIINALQDVDAVYHSDYTFGDLYEGGENYFLRKQVKTTEGKYQQGVLHTNFIPDAFHALLDDLEQKVSGGQLTGYRMGEYFPHGHISQWPEGRYHKAHYHGPGAILLGLDGQGYVLAWESKLGARPYKNGHGDQVLRVEWGKNSIYSPPNAYFHQHFNSGRGPARHAAVYGEHHPMSAFPGNESDGGWKGFKSYTEGGTLIEYEEEDPQIRADFEAALAKNGITSAMPPVTYKP